MALSKNVKLWIFITTVIYFVYNLWEIYEAIEGIFINIPSDGLALDILSSNPILMIIVFSPLVGLILRFAGSCIAVIVTYLVWTGKIQGFLEAKSRLSKVVLMEAIYFISIVPNFIFITIVGSPAILFSYIIQTFLTIPFLLILRRKINNSEGKSFGPYLTRWTGLTFVAYVGAIWVNHVSRWLDMSIDGGLTVLQTSLNPLGVFNSFVILSLALILAVTGFLAIKKTGLTSKWFGLSMTMLGLHFIILLIFYTLLNSLHVVYLFELWTVPLFGLGLALIIAKKRAKTE